MEIHLIRHGKTIANEQRLYCGAADLPLSENGKKEIAELKNQGIYPSADLYFTSGLLRTEQTIDIIYGNVQRKIIPDIAEYKFGLFEMKSYEDLKEQDDYQAWITDETGDFQCPNGENKIQFNKRAINGFNTILNEVRKIGGTRGAPRPTVVCCHGGTIACIMEYLYPNTQNFYEWQPKPGRGYTLIYDNKLLVKWEGL